MFDAKSILESIVRSAAPQTNPQTAGAGHGGGIQGGGGLSDILGQLTNRLGGAASGDGNSGSASGADILAQLKAKLNEAGGAIADGGSVTDILGKVLTQATQGVQEGAGRVGEATGATDALRQVVSDPKAQELFAKAKELIAQNQLAAGAAAGSLGGLVLGTKTGRSVAAGAVKVGAIAMIGGLAYKAYQNYQDGKPLITGAAPASPPPAGSGFEPSAVTNDTATRLIQAMIAAAAADGQVDAGEQAKIMGNLKQSNFGNEAETFLAAEIKNPKSPEQLASGVTSAEEAAQIYTAARLAVSASAPAEKQFLSALAAALNIAPKLAAHIDATATGAAAA